MARSNQTADKAHILIAIGQGFFFFFFWCYLFCFWKKVKRRTLLLCLGEHLWEGTWELGHPNHAGSLGTALDRQSLHRTAYDFSSHFTQTVFLLSRLFFPFRNFFSLKFGGKCWKLYIFNIFQHIFKVIRTNFCPVYILVFESQLKGRRKAVASSVGRSRRSRKWTSSAPPPCWTSTTSRTTWPTACSCAASAGQAPPRQRRGKARLKRELFPAPLSCREQNPGKRKRDHATAARKIDFTEDNLRCKLSVLFCGR